MRIAPRPDLPARTAAAPQSRLPPALPPSSHLRPTFSGYSKDLLCSNYHFNFLLLGQANDTVNLFPKKEARNTLGIHVYHIPVQPYSDISNGDKSGFVELLVKN